MTAYFDRMTSQVLKAPDEALAALDEEIVRDMSLACSEPGFPPDLRAKIDQLLLEWSPTVNGKLQLAPWTGPSDTMEPRECLRKLLWDLHSCFHELAEIVPGRGDGPLVWIGSLEAEAEERREALALKLRGRHINPFNMGLPEAQPAKTRLKRAVAELRELGTLLRNDPPQFADAEGCWVSSDDAMALEQIADKLVKNLPGA